MFKKFILVSAVALASSFSYAKIVELNNLNAALCQQQLTHGNSESATTPVVLMYMRDCYWAKKIMPIYEEVANEHPDMTFFRYDFQDANPMVAHYCFNGATPWVSPQIYIFNVVASYGSDAPGFVNGIQKAGLDGGATKQDILNFLEIGDKVTIKGK